MRRTIGFGFLVVAAVMTLAFLALPIVGIFVHTSPGKLLDQLSNPVVKDAFVVSIKTSLLAQALILLLGTPTAYLLATRRFPGYSLAVTLVELPLVLPPRWLCGSSPDNRVSRWRFSARTCARLPIPPRKRIFIRVRQWRLSAEWVPWRARRCRN